jgi:hypothetical protein
MADEQETIDSPELETAIAEDQDDNLTEEIQEEGQEGEDEGKEPEIEYAEIERNGKRYQVPKELEGEFMMQGDYTKKTQEVSEKRRELEAFEERVKQQAQVSEEELHERATLVNMSNELQKYQNVDWDALENEDPMSAQKHWRTFQTLQQHYAQLNHNVGQRQEFRTREAQQETAKRIEETRAFAQKEIPGWSPELDGKILEFVESKGISKAAIAPLLTPQAYEILHLAYVGSKTLQKQAAAPKSSAPPAQPLTKITARANPPTSGLDDRLSQDEWLKRRNAQLAKRG